MPIMTSAVVRPAQMPLTRPPRRWRRPGVRRRSGRPRRSGQRDTGRDHRRFGSVEPRDLARHDGEGKAGGSHEEDGEEERGPSRGGDSARIFAAGRAKAVAKIRDWLAGHDILLAGRYSEWEYYNSDHAFIAGKKAADEVADRAQRKMMAQQVVKQSGSLVMSGD
jgi:hypothetical protein